MRAVWTPEAQHDRVASTDSSIACFSGRLCVAATSSIVCFLYAFKIVRHPGDQGEPVLTILLSDED